MSATTIPASSRWFSTGLAAACGLLVFAVLIGGGLRAAEMLIALIAGVGLILLAAARPGVALGVILAFVPLQPPLLALLLRLGPPIVLVKDLGYVKDAMVAGICVAVINEQAKHHGITRKLDLLDRAAGAYLGIATLYLFLPFAFSDILGGESWFVRLSAWRLDCLFVILLLAARRLPWQGDTLRRLRYVVGVVAAVMITFSIWESISSHTYDNFLLHTLRLPDYQTSVLDGSPPLNGSYVVHGTVGGKDIVRDGSLLGSPLDLGFLMVIPLALGFERITGSGFKGNAWVVAIGSGAALLLTITRSAILAGVIAVLLAVRLSYQRLSPARLRLLVILIASIALAIPLTSHTTVRDRFATIFNSNDQDNQYHSANSHNGLRVILHKPFGKGLGANPATGYSQNTSNYTDAENSYLQVGTELGDPAMVAFVIMYLALLVELSRRARIRNESGWLSGAMWTAGGGLLVGGFFLQVWTSLPTSLTFWGLAGAALGPAVASAVVDTEDDDLDVDVAPLSSSA